MSHVGRYELVRRLAAGGMAEVFLARVAGPGGFEKQVVVKRILPELASDPRFVELFLAEAKISARLGHQNIVQIFDFGEADGSYFIAMEYVDGPSLRAVLRTFARQGWPFPLDLACRIAISAAEALAYAHEFRDGGIFGVIHRDVSPENIIVSRSGGVKLVDFGIAKAVSGAGESRTTARRGKHSYMAPEQIRSKGALDGRVDVFALGVVLYEMVTGISPFRRGAELATLQAILFEEPPPVSSMRQDATKGLDAVIARALAKDRDQRFPNCRELLMALERVLIADYSKSVTGMELATLAKAVEAAPPPPPPAIEVDLDSTAQREAVTEPGERDHRATIPLPNAATLIAKPPANGPATLPERVDDPAARLPPPGARLPSRVDLPKVTLPPAPGEIPDAPDANLAATIIAPPNPAPDTVVAAQPSPAPDTIVAAPPVPGPPRAPTGSVPVQAAAGKRLPTGTAVPAQNSAPPRAPTGTAMPQQGAPGNPGRSPTGTATPQQAGPGSSGRSPTGTATPQQPGPGNSGRSPTGTAMPQQGSPVTAAPPVRAGMGTATPQQAGPGSSGRSPTGTATPQQASGGSGGAGAAPGRAPTGTATPQQGALGSPGRSPTGTAVPAQPAVNGSPGRPPTGTEVPAQPAGPGLSPRRPAADPDKETAPPLGTVSLPDTDREEAFSPARASGEKKPAPGLTSSMVDTVPERRAPPAARARALAQLETPVANAGLPARAGTPAWKWAVVVGVALVLAAAAIALVSR